MMMMMIMIIMIMMMMMMIIIIIMFHKNGGLFVWNYCSSTLAKSFYGNSNFTGKLKVKCNL